MQYRGNSIITHNALINCLKTIYFLREEYIRCRMDCIFVQIVLGVHVQGMREMNTLGKSSNYTGC